MDDWAEGYFSVAESGELVVRPTKGETRRPPFHPSQPTNLARR